MSNQNDTDRNLDLAENRRPTGTWNGRRWAWVATVLVVAGGIAWFNRNPPVAEDSNNEVAFNFEDSRDNGDAKSRIPATGASASLEPGTGNANAVIKGGITDLLNEHPIEIAAHPLDPLLLIAQRGLDNLRENLFDYSATLERQERVGEQLMPTETILIKIRQARSAEQNNGQAVARAIYTRHEAPPSLKGQEAIYVEGENDGNIVAHTTGLLNLKKLYLPPTGFLAMRGNRYPMTEAGFEVLIERMLERGQRDRDFGTCQVRADRQATINGRSCTMFEIIHPTKEGPYDFHLARIAIDDKLNLPIHYEAFTWPSQPGGKPELLERYTYTNIEINPGLPADTFDPDNPAYDFPRR